MILQFGIWINSRRGVFSRMRSVWSSNQIRRFLRILFVCHVVDCLSRRWVINRILVVPSTSKAHQYSQRLMEGRNDDDGKIVGSFEDRSRTIIDLKYTPFDQYLQWGSSRWLQMPANHDADAAGGALHGSRMIRRGFGGCPFKPSAILI